MIDNLVKYLLNKKIVILGFGLEGVSTYKFIRKHLKEQKLYIADKNEAVFEKNSFLKDDKNVELISGDNYLEDLDKYDVIMKTPGIPFITVDTTKIKDKIKSQVELLLEFTNSTTIGITGTKGKSTTSSLIYKVISDQGKPAMLLGNIGIPIFDYIDEIKDETILVLELSAHQLEFVQASPKISILINLFEEHLDHYKSFQGYINAKLNIFKFQKNGDYFLYNSDNELLKENVENIMANSKSNILEVSFTGNVKNNKNAIVKQENFIMQNDEKLYDCREKRMLLGDHNLHDAMFAMGVSQILGLDINQTAKSINTFEPLPHRMEFVGKFNDIFYYNDSIATIPQSAINTIVTLKNVSSLIIGGMDRKIDYTGFIKFLNQSNIKNIICLPTTGHNIADKLDNPAINVYKVETMVEAVKIAKEKTEKNKICVLSPAAASYGFYKNFQERGNEYKKLVMI